MNLWKCCPAAVLGAMLVNHPAIAEEFNDVHRCDEYAAHPDDTNRWATGVTDDKIVPGPAVRFCRQAVTEHSDTPRFAFQLGRSLWAAKEFNEGTQVFIALEEEAEYGPVYAYLGDAYMHGIGGVEVDEELAITLYQIADEAGFAPASEVLLALADGGDAESNTQRSGIEGEFEGVAISNSSAASLAATESSKTQAVTPQPQAPKERPFDARGYSHSRILEALNSGDLGKIRNAGLGSFNVMGVKTSKMDVYMGRFNSEFSGTYNYKDPSCIQIYQPRVGRTLEQRMLDSNFAANGLTAEGATVTGLNMIKGMMEQMERGPMEVVNQGRELELLGEVAAQDAAKLIQTYGCSNETVKRIYGNLAAFVLGGNTIKSPEEKERLKTKKIEDEKRAVENRHRQMKRSAESSCVGEFKKKAYCKCLINELEAQNIKDSEWRRLGTNFRDLLIIAKGYDGFVKNISQCRKINK